MANEDSETEDGGQFAVPMLVATTSPTLMAPPFADARILAIVAASAGLVAREGEMSVLLMVAWVLAGDWGKVR